MRGTEAIHQGRGQPETPLSSLLDSVGLPYPLNRHSLLVLSVLFFRNHTSHPAPIGDLIERGICLVPSI